MVSLLKGLSILLIFSKNQLLFFADSIVLLFPTSFISALMFILFILKNIFIYLVVLGLSCSSQAP